MHRPPAGAPRRPHGADLAHPAAYQILSGSFWGKSRENLHIMKAISLTRGIVPTGGRRWYCFLRLSSHWSMPLGCSWPHWAPVHFFCEAPAPHFPAPLPHGPTPGR
eukprot:scaffold1318_cov388-Prasinococcus_capsulatus_cf.AAC.36